MLSIYFIPSYTLEGSGPYKLAQSILVYETRIEDILKGY